MIKKEWTNNQLLEMFGDYFNNFLTVSRWAEYYGFSHKESLAILEKGKKLWNDRAESFKTINQVKINMNQDLCNCDQSLDLHEKIQLSLSYIQNQIDILTTADLSANLTTISRLTAIKQILTYEGN